MKFENAFRAVMVWSTNTTPPFMYFVRCFVRCFVSLMNFINILFINKIIK